MDQNENAVANFIQKSFEILENKEYQRIIQWASNGKEFAIKDIEEFEQSILPKYFRHRNINSFIRQLNMYGFHKSRKEPTKNIFSHPNFLKSYPQILHLVKRKIKTDEKIEENPQEIIKTEVVVRPRRPSEHENMECEKKCEDQTAIKPRESCSIMSTKAMIQPSFFEIPLQSFNFQIDGSPFKSLMSKSCIMDCNPQIYLKMRELMEQDGHDEDNDDALSINGQIENQQKVFHNRMSGISILDTCNFINDL